MAAKRTRIYLGRLVLAWLAVSGLMASEYRGAVKAGGLPVPGATVTATQGATKHVTTTDERGAFQFAGLADGIWTIEVEMLGFAKLTRQVSVGPGAPATDWELKFLPVEALVASLRPTPAAAPQAKSQAPASRPQAQRGQPAAQARPSQLPGGGFQRLDLSQAADAGALTSEGALRSEEIADLSQTAANSFIVQGSMSSALGLPQENDWRIGMLAMGFDPMAGPGMMGMGAPGVGGPGGEMQGPGGPGGFAGPGGGPGGPPGGGPMAGGPGGPGGGRFGGGFGGPGGPAGARGGRNAQNRPNWQGRPNAMAFGNARRNQRNRYMGSLFFSLDNSFWDARSFSVTGASVDKPAYANARGGIMFGGPLQIPKLVSREKRILFFFNYQFQRSRTGTISQPVNMPTALERGGDFSQTMLQGAPIAIFDPTTGMPFPGNRIPANRISATASALLKYFPDPNLPFAARNYQTSWTGVSNSQNLNSRIANLRIGGKDTLNGSVGYQGSENSNPNLFRFIDTGAGRGINASLGWSHNITPHLINNLRYTFSRNRQLVSPFFAYRENVAAELGIAGVSQDPMNWGPPNLSFTNYASLTDGNYALNRTQTSSAGDSLLWIRGRHSFMAGGDYRRQQFNQLADTNGRGAYLFNGSATSLIVNGVAQSGTGYDLADFLLGMPTTSSIRYGNPDKYFRGSGYGLFFNDDWRMSARFTLNVGIRWDYATPMSELYSRLVNLDIAPGFSAVTPVEAGRQGPYSGALPETLIKPDRNNFSPRLGFAWRPLAGDSTVVRGGYGVYYNTSVYNIIASNLAQQPPFARALSVSSSPDNPLSIQTGFLAASNQTLLSTFAIDPNYRIGYAQTWTLSVQHDLPFSMFGTIGYLGTKGTRLDQQFIPNSVPPGAAESALPHSFIYETSNGNSIYHAAQFQLVRRFHSGLAANVSYQLSKSIDNAGTGGRGQANTPVAQNWLDLSAERGLSSFDARHNLAVRFQYSTGMGRSGGTLVNGWKGALMKDWTISWNISLRSGNPFTATVGGNRSQVSGTAVSNTVRANATGLPVKVPGMLFNTAAFAAPAPGQWGNAGRNTIPGPTTFFLNGAVGRIFRMGERRSVDLQLQAQNILNHVTITSWGTVVGANNYGLATGAAEMRRLTAVLRFRF